MKLTITEKGDERSLWISMDDDDLDVIGITEKVADGDHAFIEHAVYVDLDELKELYLAGCMLARRREILDKLEGLNNEQ